MCAELLQAEILMLSEHHSTPGFSPGILRGVLRPAKTWTERRGVLGLGCLTLLSLRGGVKTHSPLVCMTAAQCRFLGWARMGDGCKRSHIALLLVLRAKKKSRRPVPPGKKCVWHTCVYFLQLLLVPASDLHVL